MHRPIIYDEEQADPFDILWALRDILAALGGLEMDMAGQTTTLLGGFAISPTSPASLSLNLAAGRIYQQGPMDSTAYGALAADTSTVQQQGYAAAQAVTLSTTGLSAGQSMWALIQAQFSQTDVVRTGDPTNGVLNYWNSNNPTQPFQGPNNNGQAQPTERRATVSLQVIYGTPASTGSEVPPTPTNGWVPLYLVDLTYAQSSVVSNQILIAGPSVGANVPGNYPGAPFLAGLLNQHHKGIAGQGPKIDLLAEVKNALPLANMLASSTSGGGVPVFKLNAGNPNGNVAGNFNVNGTQDFCWDLTNKILYACTQTGTASTAIWQAITGGSTNIFAGGTSTGAANAQVVSSTVPAGFTLTAGNVVTFVAGFTNTGAVTLNVDGTGVINLKKNTGTVVNLAAGDIQSGQFITVVYDGTEFLLESATLGALATLNIGKWLKNDGSGNLTIKNGTNLIDDGSGNLEVDPQFLPQIGSLDAYLGTAAPTGWLLCQGQAVSRTTYAALFALCGITYGGGDGINTFNLPDLRGRVIAGVDGGAGRLTTASMSSTSLGGTGGSETITLTSAQIPAHTHPNTLSDPGHTHTYTLNANQATLTGGGSFPLNNNPTTASTSSATTGITITNASNTGGGGSHLNVQPTIELNYIVKY